MTRAERQAKAEQRKERHRERVIEERQRLGCRLWEFAPIQVPTRGPNPWPPYCAVHEPWNKAQA
jgi:hypothetical protein